MGSLKERFRKSTGTSTSPAASMAFARNRANGKFFDLRHVARPQKLSNRGDVVAWDSTDAAGEPLG